MFHPFQYQYEAKWLHEQEEPHCLFLKQGAFRAKHLVFKNLLPQVLSGKLFLSIQESKKGKRLACLRATFTRFDQLRLLFLFFFSVVTSIYSNPTATGASLQPLPTRETTLANQ